MRGAEARKEHFERQTLRLEFPKDAKEDDETKRIRRKSYEVSESIFPGLANRAFEIITFVIPSSFL